jgi:hypothetical protein
MNFSVIGFSRAAFLTLAGLGGLLAASALASDRTSSGAERWALRPARSPEPTPAPAPVLRGVKSIPLSDLPGERRSVRVIYQGYGPVTVASER